MMRNYTSFFSERFTKTTANVSGLLSTNTHLAQQAASSLKENAKRCHAIATLGSHALTEKVTQAIGSKQCETLADHYNVAKNKVSNFIESEEVLRVKNIFEGSMNAVLSTNFLFDLGIMLIPGTGSFHAALQCSKYLIASMIFVLSACKEQNIGSQDQVIPETMELYQSQMDAAYDVTQKLQTVFSHIEALLQNEPLFLSSKDFENNVTVENDASEMFDLNMLFRSLLDGTSKAVWVQYLIKMITLSLSVTCPLNGMLILTILTYSSLTALSKEQSQVANEKKWNLLLKQLPPIYSTLQKIEQKLYLTDKEEKVSSNKTYQALEIDFYDFADKLAKSSGLYFLLKELSHTYKGFNFLICFAALQFTIYDFYSHKKKEQSFDCLFKDFESKMKMLVEMTEKMEKLLLKQQDYEKFLVESNNAREEYRKSIETYKLEQLKKADEERKQEEKLRELEAAFQKELKRLDAYADLKPPVQMMRSPQSERFIKHHDHPLKIAEEAKPVHENKCIPALLNGLLGAGLGWLIGVSISLLLIAPTCGLSLVVPAVCALMGGIIGFLMTYMSSPNIKPMNNTNSMFYKKGSGVDADQIVNVTVCEPACVFS